MNELEQVNCIDETGKYFKLVPKKYRSSFNRLTLVHDEYKIYCEPVDKVCCDYEDFENIGLALEYLEQEIGKAMYDKIANSTKVEW